LHPLKGILTLKRLERGYNYVGQEITNAQKLIWFIGMMNLTISKFYLSQFMAAKLIDIG
jgi:hypothetical protein